ncbi:hypothetical protein [Pseudarthrobacter sp. PvP090]|uniref:hypothetical protein n=1 Tax=Pseudarthrobacter sp. PvP090 TaxID=3156393 RepID=UPI0033996A3D
MEAHEDRTVQSGERWGHIDELNWAADRATIRSLNNRGEEPSEWLATEYRELNARRAAAATRG